MKNLFSLMLLCEACVFVFSPALKKKFLLI